VIATKPRLHVLAVAPLSSSQGLDDAMEAVAMVRAAGVDCRLRIIGRGSYRPALLYTRGQLGLSRYVELEDPMDWFAPRCGQALAWGDVLLDASLRDPPLAAIAAARARGMPVISTAVASLAGADDAIAVPPGEPEAIAGALRAHAAGQAAQPSMTSAAASSIVHSRASPASVSSSSR
jgi:glycosyltransferase involved in cell wall biosynthesis